jgi:hypothetical protein
MPVMGFTKFERFLRAAWLAAAVGPAHPATVALPSDTTMMR